MANYDPVAALDFEKRLGIEKGDIDDFLRKATAVQDAISGLKNGTIDASKEIKIEGIETESEKKAKEEDAAQRKAKYLEKEKKKAAQRKEEEREKWWRGAELWMDMPENMRDEDQEDDEEGGGDGEAKSGKAKAPSSAEMELVAKQQALLRRYSNDYSRWEHPVEDDPATLAEVAEAEAAKEAAANAAFEANNPDFCGNFRKDQAERVERAAAKAESANVLRLKGNRFFKAKRYAEAIERYMSSLKEKPFDVATLSNVSLCHLKTKCYEDALEFANRALHVNAQCSKARSRKATALHAMNQLDEALKEARLSLEAASARSKDMNLPSSDRAAACAEAKAAERQVGELAAEVADRSAEAAVAAAREQAKKHDAETARKAAAAQAAAAAAKEKEEAARKKAAAEKAAAPASTSGAIASARGSSSSSSSSGVFKKVAIEMDEDSSSDEEGDHGGKATTSFSDQPSTPPAGQTSAGRRSAVGPPGSSSAPSSSTATANALMMRALLQGAGAEGGEGNGGSSSNNNNNNNKMNDLLASMPGMQKAMEEMLLNGGEGAVGGDEQGGSSNLAGMMAALEAIGSAAGAGSEVQQLQALMSQLAPHLQQEQQQQQHSGAPSTSSLPPLPDAVTAGAMTLPGVPSQFQLVDDLVQAMQEATEKGTHAKAPSGMPALDALTVLLAQSSEARVHFRTSGGLALLCARVRGGGLAEPRPDAGAIVARPDQQGFDLDDVPSESGSSASTSAPRVFVRDPDPGRSLVCLAAAVHNERRSKQAVLDQGALSAACQLLDPSGAAATSAATAAATITANDDDKNDDNKSGTATAKSGAGKGAAAGKGVSAAQRSMLDAAAAEHEGSRDVPLVSQLVEAGRLGEACQVAAAALVASMVEDGQAEVGRRAALFVAKDMHALSGIFGLLPGSSTTSPADDQTSLVPGFAARCFNLGASILRDLALHDTCRDQLLKKCSQLDPSAKAACTEAAPLTATFRFGKEDKANAEAKLKKAAAEKAAKALPLAPEPIGCLANALLETVPGKAWWSRHHNPTDKKKQRGKSNSTSAAAPSATATAAATAAVGLGREACAGALANFMLSEAYRPRVCFQSHAAVRGLLSCLSAAAGASTSSTRTATAATAVATPDSAASVAFALAALMNATLAEDQPTLNGNNGGGVGPRAAVVACGGVKALLPLLRGAQDEGGAGSNGKSGKSAAAAAAKKKTVAVSADSSVIFVRAAGLLSRVATSPSAQQQLQQDANALADIARAIESNNSSGLSLQNGNGTTGNSSSSGGGSGGSSSSSSLSSFSSPSFSPEVVNWLISEREHLARVAAVVLAGNGASLAVKAWHASGTLAILLSWLPPPRVDAKGAVTADSVVMPPLRPTSNNSSSTSKRGSAGKHSSASASASAAALAALQAPSARLCGNVVKCFVAVVEQPTSAAAQRLVKAGLLEKLVALLANTQELAVRKNVAVVLARAMRDDSAKERVRELRGIEMLVQLGPQL